MDRTNRIGLKYELIEVGQNQTMIIHGDKSIIVPHALGVVNQAWYNWQMKGHMIQTAFHFMSPDEREFIMTAITPAEWTGMFDGSEV